MSRSNPTLTNPAQRFFSWSGSKGKVVYWDKENKVEVEVKLPFVFLPLDQLSTIKGYSKIDKSGYWSNEVRNVTKDSFTVRTSHGIKEDGLYSTLANSRSKGAKYTKSIYCAYKQGDDWILANFNASGSALSAWIEFSNGIVVENGKVALTGSTHVPEANGISEYYIPTFEYQHSTPEEDKIAIAMDKDLQVYLSQYLAQPHVSEEEDASMDGTTTDSLEPPAKSRATMKHEDEEDDQAVKTYLDMGEPLPDYPGDV